MRHCHEKSAVTDRLLLKLLNHFLTLDGLVHCKTETEAHQMMAELKIRFEACKLELHSTKTKIVYCKDEKRKGQYPQTEFTFLV